MNVTDWQLLNQTDTPLAYSKFHEAIPVKHHACVLYRTFLTIILI